MNWSKSPSSTSLTAGVFTSIPSRSSRTSVYGWKT